MKISGFSIIRVDFSDNVIKKFPFFVLLILILMVFTVISASGSACNKPEFYGKVRVLGNSSLPDDAGNITVNVGGQGVWKGKVQEKDTIYEYYGAFNARVSNEDSQGTDWSAGRWVAGTQAIGTEATVTIKIFRKNNLEEVRTGKMRLSGRAFKVKDKNGKFIGYLHPENIHINVDYNDGTKDEFFVTGIGCSILTVSGKITDGFNHPLKHANVTFKYGDIFYRGITDSDGKYSFEFPGTFEDNKEGRLYVKLQYIADNKIYFRILNQSDPVWIMKKFKISNSSGLKQDFDLNSNLDPASHFGSSNINIADISHFSIMYHHMTEALEFYKDNLNANVEYKLPVDVEAFRNMRVNAYYNHESGTIFINVPTSLHSTPQRPDNREWHEFSHHVMYSMYGRRPLGPGSTVQPQWPFPVINHFGYLNPSTNDSFTEGFAIFGSMIIKDHYRYGNPQVYSPIGNFEVNYKAWDKLGRAESRAIAGVLWDLYDSRNEPQDNVQLDLMGIWDVLKVYHKDFTSVYEGFVTRFPGSKNDIDTVFVEHGIFKDTTPGNRTRDPEEPFWDLDRNGYYTSTSTVKEPWIDYANEQNLAFPWMIHQENEIIGQATNYHRPWRTSIGELPGHYIKVVDKIPYYLVKISFPENPEWDYEVRTEKKGGLIYVEVPPAAYNTIITVSAEGAETGNPLTFTSSDFMDKYPESVEKGFYVEHDFRITGKSTHVPEQFEPGLFPDYLTEFPPHWEHSSEAEPEDYVYKPPKEDPFAAETGISKEAFFNGLIFESRSKPTGSSVQVPLTLRGVEQKIGNMDLTLGYDPSVLEATEVIKGGLTADSISDYNILRNGKVKISLADSQGFNGDGSVAYVKFNVIGAEGTSCPLKIEMLESNRAEDYEVMDVQVNDGVFRVISVEESRGDSDGNRELTALDALYALQIAVGKKSLDLVMDVNKDGSVTSLDARRILEIAVGSENN